MLNSLTRFLFVSLFLVTFSHSTFAADDVVTTSNAQLPQWFYQELIAIKKDVSDLDAKQVSEGEVQNLKDRLSKVETVLEVSEKDIDERLDAQDKFIDAIYASTDRFGIIAGVLGVIIAGIAFFFSSGAKREAVASAKESADIEVEKWTIRTLGELRQNFEQEIRSLSTTYDTKLHERLDELEKKYIDSLASVQQSMSVQQDAAALLSKAYALLTSNKCIEAIEVYDSIDKQFKERKETEIERQVAEALLNKGVALNKLNRFEEAIYVYSELIKRFNGNSELAIQEQIAKALMDKGAILVHLGDLENAIVVCDELLKRFKVSDQIALQVQVVIALMNKGNTLDELDRSEEAIKVYYELIEQFKDSDELAMQEQVAKALLSNASILIKSHRIVEAVTVLDQLIEKYVGREELNIQDIVQQAIELSRKLKGQ
ncbi:tetratricopeptide repeat protein [Marinomonas sp. 5E14-1]|uniref:tetratricopeptide repeat protein n=1 Tax=Marinomonas sp. 5E14-1 TaxID=3153922 RepID=UPI003262FE24